MILSTSLWPVLKFLRKEFLPIDTKSMLYPWDRCFGASQIDYSTRSGTIALLQQYCGSETHPLSDVLLIDGTVSNVGLHSNARSLTLHSSFGPGAGWVLFQSRYFTDRDRAALNVLRQRGYCFWDYDSLNAWGFRKTEKKLKCS